MQHSQALRYGVCHGDLSNEPIVQRELNDIAGTWVEDPKIDDALADQRRIDPELWNKTAHQFEIDDH